MRVTHSLSIRLGLQSALVVVVLCGSVTSALAQEGSQNLVIQFTQANIIQGVPLSPALTIAIALILGVVAFVIMRRQATRGGRVLGWLLALAALATLAVAGRQVVITDAQASTPATAPLNLSVSPASLALFSYWDNDDDPLTVTVTNMTGQSVTLTSVELVGTDFYDPWTPTTCTVGLVLGPGGQCTVTLAIV